MNQRVTVIRPTTMTDQIYGLSLGMEVNFRNSKTRRTSNAISGSRLSIRLFAIAKS